MFHISNAIQEIHLRGYTHRDIKTENIMITNDGTAKLIDLGLVSDSEEMTDFVGSPYNVAPEILKTERTIKNKLYIHDYGDSFCSSNFYTNKVDIWSLGIVLFQMLIGHLPFGLDRSKNVISIFTKIIDSHLFIFEDVHSTKVSDDAKDLLFNMLAYDSQKRYAIRNVLNHRWMNYFCNND